MIEKAFAKAYGNYQKLEEGAAGETLSILTGAPSVYYSHSKYKKDPEKFEKLMLDAAKFGYCVAASYKGGAHGTQGDDSYTVKTFYIL